MSKCSSLKLILNLLSVSVCFSGSGSALADNDLHGYQEQSEAIRVTVEKSDLSEVVVDPLLGSPFNVRKILPAHSYAITGLSTAHGEARLDIVGDVLGLPCNSEHYFCEIDLYVNNGKVVATISAGTNDKIVRASELPVAWQINPSDTYNNIRLRKPVAFSVGHMNDKNEIEWTVSTRFLVYSAPASGNAEQNKKDPVQPLCAKNSTLGTCLSRFPVIVQVQLSQSK